MVYKSLFNFCLLYSHEAFKEDMIDVIQCGAKVIGIKVTVDAYDIGKKEVPVLQTLLRYDAILYDTSSGYLYSDPVLVGDALANISDSGIGLVLCTFSNLSNYNQCLKGRFFAENYNPFTYSEEWSSSHATPLVLEPVDVTHPILHGVKSFNGGSYSGFVVCEEAKNSRLIARWSDNGKHVPKLRPLVAEVYNPVHPHTRIIGLNACTASNKQVTSCWDRKTDGHILVANALVYASGRRNKTLQQVIKKNLERLAYTDIVFKFSY